VKRKSNLDAYERGRTVTNGRTFVVADIHGDIDGLETILLDMYADGMNLNRDTLVQLGDMIDGYEHSSTVVEFWRGIQAQHPDNVVVLLGNHEDMLMRAVGKNENQSDFRNWWDQGGAATYYSYFSEDTYPPFIVTPWLPEPNARFDPTGQMKSDLEWFATLPLYHETEDFIFVHAGLVEPLPPAANRRWDMLWVREPFHKSTYDWGKPVVYGHTAREFPLVERNKIGLDTRWRGKGYVSGAELTREGKDGDPLYVRKLYVG
jgi:serine/threonine protein phosphatase 1